MDTFLSNRDNFVFTEKNDFEMDALLSDNSVFTEKNEIRSYFGPGETIQACNPIETMMARSGEYGSMNTVHVHWLKSKQSITAEDVLQSLYIVSRRVPHLQLCLEKRGRQLYFKRMANFEIDFEILEGEVMEVFEAEIDKTFNLCKGPLWKVKLVRSSVSLDLEMKDEYFASLIFIAQHCISDGVTNMVISREIVANLNKIIAGKLVEPVYVPIPGNIKEDIKSNLPSSFNRFSKVCTKFNSTMIRNFSHKSSFGGAFPIPKTNVSSTKVLSGELSIAETENIARMCKENGITINSFIVTMINFALLSVAHSWSKTNLESATLNVTHCVNMRRYFGPYRREDSGCLISFLEDKVKISMSDVSDFWEVAKKMNSNIQDRIEQKEPVAVFPLLKLAWILIPTNKYLTRKGYRNKTDCHYVATNMGNLKNLLPGPVQGDAVEITKLLRSGSIKYAGSPFVVAFQTFRDQLSISMDYCTNKITCEVAHQIFELLLLNIRNMIYHKNLH